MSNDCWLFCSWGCWKFCDSGCWLFSVWGHWRFLWLGALSILGVHSWLVLHISMPGFFMFFLILQMGQCSPHEHFSVACLSITMTWGIAAILGGSSVLVVAAGMGNRVWGIGQSFLVSNKFSEADSALDQGVPYLSKALGMSSRSVGLEFYIRVDGHGTSLNFLVARLYTITGIDIAVDLVTGIWVDVVATVGAGVVEFSWSGCG